MEKLDWFNLLLLAGNLADTQRRLAPGERVTLRRYLQRCLPRPYSREMVDRLRAWELCLWIDGRPAPDTDVLVEQASRVVLYVHQGNTVRLVDPDPQAALN